MQATRRRAESRSARASRAGSRTSTAPAQRGASSPGRSGPTSRTASLSPDVNDPGFRNISFDELAAAYAEVSPGADRGRRRRDSDRDHVRHLECQGSAVRGPTGVRRGRRGAAHHRFRHHHRCLWTHPVGTNDRGVLEFHPARQARWWWGSIARSAAGSCAPTSRSWRASPTPTSAPIRTRACRTPSANTTKRRRETARDPARVRRRAASSTWWAAAAAPRPSTSCAVDARGAGHCAAQLARHRTGLPPERAWSR